MKTLDLRDVETDITFPLQPIIPLFPPLRCRAKVENSKLQAVRAAAGVDFLGDAGRPRRFPDERNVFTAAQGGWAVARAVANLGSVVNASHGNITVSAFREISRYDRKRNVAWPVASRGNHVACTSWTI